MSANNSLHTRLVTPSTTGLPLLRLPAPTRRSIAAQATGCRLLGVGSSVPETVLTNADLEKLVETSDDWIRRRTGIKERRVLGSGELLGDHAHRAAAHALEMADVEAEGLDLVIMATSSPDDIFGNACQVRHVNLHHK